MKNYHNTTAVGGTQLSAFIDKAGAQDKLVLTAFSLSKFSPGQLYEYLVKSEAIAFNTPITSIRRSITNLTKDGKLIKTTEQVKGIYGRPEYVWKLA